MASLREAAERIQEKEEENRDLSEKFDEIDEIEQDSVVKESALRHEIEENKPGTVAGIDGGVSKKKYSSADVVAVRAVAACFSFSSTGVDATYLPGKDPEPEFHVMDPEDQQNLDANTEKHRLVEETSVALEALKQVDTVLMDGSIIPSYSKSEKVLENYNKMFDEADEGALIGVVEDSFGTSLSEILEEKTGVELGSMRDTQVMDAILYPGQRSFVRRYSKGPAEHPVMKKISPEHARKINTFYVKLSPRDRPLRIDYYGSPDKADEIASKLLYMRSSKSYTVPSPIVEADRKAKIPSSYLKRLEKRFSPELRRRERRVF